MAISYIFNRLKTKEYVVNPHEYLNHKISSITFLGAKKGSAKKVTT